MVVDDIDITNSFKLWQPFIGECFHCKKRKKKKKNTYLVLLGAQKEFSVTDKYTRKSTVTNWGKPCIWLNNQNPLEVPNLEGWKREYLLANCIFVNLEHRLYRPEEVVAPLFLPPVDENEELEYIDPPVGGERVVIDENTVFLEDLM